MIRTYCLTCTRPASVRMEMNIWDNPYCTQHALNVLYSLTGSFQPAALRPVRP